MGEPASSWPWQRLNEGNASSHEVLATLLEPERGERWLDVATGGGGLALQLARKGADVVGVDIAEDGLDHASAAAAEAGLSATFRYGDACALPFEAATFDGVASAFGVIFAADAERAAGELARVCRTGGKLGLTLMPTDSRAGETFGVLGRHGAEPPNPTDWSTSVERLLGEDFELSIERRESTEPRRPPLEWDEAVRSLAPLRAVVARLDDAGVAALRSELDAVEERYRERPHFYTIVLGRRR